MSEVEEKLLLRWNEFEVEVPDSRRQMWEEREFTDVTLATADEQQISSHRLILSAHSSFFKRILMKNPQQNLVVYLKDICLSELELVLEYVYTGKVEVWRKELQTFLATGRELGFKGMEVSYGAQLDVDPGGRVKQCQGAQIDGRGEGIERSQAGNGRTESHQQQIHIGKSDNFPMTRITETKEFEEPQMGMDVTSQKAHTDVMFRLNKQIKRRTTSETNKPTIKHTTNSQDKQKTFLGSTDEVLIRNSPGFQETTKLPTMGFKMKSRPPAVFACDTCGTQFLARATLEQHNITAHSWTVFNCTQCNFKTVDPNSLGMHKEAQH